VRKTDFVNAPKPRACAAESDETAKGSELSAHAAAFTAWTISNQLQPALLAQHTFQSGSL
jgi:hypothetical protein